MAAARNVEQDVEFRHDIEDIIGKPSVRLSGASVHEDRMKISPSFSIAISEQLSKWRFKRTESRLLGDISNISWHRKFAVEVLENHAFELFVGSLILFNLFLIIAETDATADGDSAPGWISFTNYMLITIYTLEVSAKLFAYHRRFFHCNWNIMDLSVISLDVMFIFLELVAGGMPKVSVFRIFRLVRLMRAFKAMSMFPELAMLLRGFMSAIRAIFWGMLLIVVFITIWSILAVQLIHPLNKEVARLDPNVYSGCERCPRAFQSVFQSNLTIFQTIVAGDSWGQLALPIIEHNPLAVLFFLCVLVTVGIAIMNLILAVIVDRAQGTKQESLEEIIKQKEKEFGEAAQHLLKLCSGLDSDHSGFLSKDEIMAGFESEEFAMNMTVMSLEKEDMCAIFDVLDDDGSGDVSYKELVKQLFRFRQPDLRTAIFELTRLHQKVQNLAAVTKTSGDENHNSLIALLTDTRDHVHAVHAIHVDPDSPMQRPAFHTASSSMLGSIEHSPRPSTTHDERIGTVEVTPVHAPPPLTLPQPPSPETKLDMKSDEVNDEVALGSNFYRPASPSHSPWAGPDPLMAGLLDLLRQMNEELGQHMGQLLQTSEAHSRLLFGMRSSMQEIYGKLEQTVPSKWEGLHHSPSFGRSPMSSGRLLDHDGAISPLELQVRVTETLLRDNESNVRSLLSDPSRWNGRHPQTPPRTPPLQLIPQERAPPPTNLLGLGACCKSQPELRVPIDHSRVDLSTVDLSSLPEMRVSGGPPGIETQRDGRPPESGERR